jgi:hypothetical protein
VVELKIVSVDVGFTSHRRSSVQRRILSEAAQIGFLWRGSYRCHHGKPASPLPDRSGSVRSNAMRGIECDRRSSTAKNILGGGGALMNGLHFS